MAKFKGRDLYLNDDDQIYFGDNAEAAMWYDNNGELHLNHTLSGVAAVEPYHVVILSQLEDAIGGVTASGGGGIYGSYYAYAKSDGVSSTNSTAWVNKISLTTSSIPSGDYKINWYAEMHRNSQANDLLFRVYLDNTTELCNINHEHSDQSNWFPLSGFDVVTLASGTHTVAVQFAGETTGNTSDIRRARVDITRIL
jgi:hypothetical protein